MEQQSFPDEKIIITKPTKSSTLWSDDIEIINMKDEKLCYLTTKVPYWDHSKYGLHEQQMIEWVKNAYCVKDKTFLDIGANSGIYTISLANYCGKVYGFEPQRSTYYALCGGVYLSKLKNVECMNIGLGSPEQRGKQKLFIQPKDYGNGIFSSLNPLPGTFPEEIEIKTLDDLNISNIAFIKLDVEGNETNVFKGAKETLIRNNQPTILFESCTEETHKLDSEILYSYGYRYIYSTIFDSMYVASR